MVDQYALQLEAERTLFQGIVATSLTVVMVESYISASLSARGGMEPDAAVKMPSNGNPDITILYRGIKV